MVEQAEIHRMANSANVEERKTAVEQLRDNFALFSDKDTAWADLQQLARDKDSFVRIHAYHSLGIASVYKATSTVDEGKFREELKKAINYFQQSSNEAEDKYENPAQFCLPFYQSYYALISRQQEAEAEATNYLDEAKKATKGSESREILLKAVENLANALKEAQKPLDFGETKYHLIACRQYCDHTAELVDSTRGKSPVAAAAIMRGIPIVGVKVKEIIAEIQEKAEALCKQTKGTEFKEIGHHVNIFGQGLSKISNPIDLEKCINNLRIPLYAICEKLPEEDKEEVHHLLEQIDSEKYIEDKLSIINIILSDIKTHLSTASEYHKKAEQYDNEAKNEVGEKKVAIIKLASEHHFKASEKYKQDGFLVDSCISMAVSKARSASIETDDAQTLNYLEEAIIQIDTAIKITDDKDIKQTRRLKGLRYEYLARKYIWFAITSKDNPSNQDDILLKIVACFMNASKIYEQEGNKEYGCKCKGCAYLYESLAHLSKGINSRKNEDFWKSLKSFKQAKRYYSAAESIVGVNIIDRIGDLIDLLKEFIDNHSECIKNRKTQRIGDFDKIFKKVLDVIEEISAPGLKKLFTIYLCDETIANVDLIEKQLSMTKEPKKEKIMTTIKINNSKDLQIGVGNDFNQVKDSIPQKRKGSKKEKTSTKPINSKKPAKATDTPKSSIPYLSELESEIADIFKSLYQKDRKPGTSEVNAKTLESLKHKIHDLKASGNNINWLDMGCGDGRCLEVLDDIQDRGNIYYHGIDILHKFLDDAQMRAKKYGIQSKIETMSTAAMEFDSEFDLISAVLFLHEVDPLCLPYVIRNMLRALKSDGTLVISDFEGPYEQEEGVVSWGAEYLEKFLSNIGGARMSPGFVPSGEFPKELGFYRCYVKKPELDEKVFQKFIEGYGGFMMEKKEDSRKMREELRNQIKKKVCEILKRPDIDLKNISDDEKALLLETMGEDYGIKALKIRLLTNEILFLDEKIGEFERGDRCGSI